MSSKNISENPATSRFREYLRIKTVQPDPDYKKAVEFLKKQAKRIGLSSAEYGTAKHPILVITWEGKDTSLPSIMLNSHMDVVPVFKDKWIHDPFEGHKTDDGKIFGRGSQDMKAQGISYLEAVDKLKNREGFIPNRTVHLVYVPDEEVGGKDGTASFVNTQEFKSLDVGFALDEACAVPTDFYLLFYDERCNWALDVICTGTTGHGSIILPNTAGEKARIVLDEFMDRRCQEAAKLAEKKNPDLEMAHVTSINCTMMRGGVQENVVPDNFTLTFDIRVSVDEDHATFEKWIQEVLKKAGEGVTVQYRAKEEKRQSTKVDENNPYWVALKKGVEKGGQKVVPVACPGNTDARFIRGVGIPAFGFSAMKKTPTLLHGHNEYLSEDVFLEGIDVYANIISEIASLG